jgi:hypothetical protein
LAADFRRWAQMGGIENRVIQKSKEEATRIYATKEEFEISNTEFTRRHFELWFLMVHFRQQLQIAH